jgi:hypothetical protein
MLVVVSIRGSNKGFFTRVGVLVFQQPAGADSIFRSLAGISAVLQVGLFILKNPDIVMESLHSLTSETTRTTPCQGQ